MLSEEKKDSLRRIGSAAAANGVSTACSSSNQYSTLEIYPTAPALSVVNLLRGLTTVINQDSDSISVTRTPYAVDSGRVGYLWTITFVKQVTHNTPHYSIAYATVMLPIYSPRTVLIVVYILANTPTSSSFPTSPAR